MSEEKQKRPRGCPSIKKGWLSGKLSGSQPLTVVSRNACPYCKHIPVIDILSQILYDKMNKMSIVFNIFLSIGNHLDVWLWILKNETSSGMWKPVAEKY